MAKLSTKVRANCGNCIYCHYNPNDAKKRMLCKAASNYHNLPVNPSAHDLVDGLWEEKRVALCEHHHARQDLNVTVVYV